MPVTLVKMPRLVQFEVGTEILVVARISNARPGWLWRMKLDWLFVMRRSPKTGRRGSGSRTLSTSQYPPGKVETDGGGNLDTDVLAGPGIGHPDAGDIDREVYEVCVSGEQLRAVGDGGGGDGDPVAGGVTVIEAELEGHAVSHAAAAADDADGEAVGTVDVELGVEGMAGRCVGSVDGIVILEQGDVRRSEQESGLAAVAVVNERAGVGDVIERAHEVLPRGVVVIGRLIPTWLG